LQPRRHSHTCASQRHTRWQPNGFSDGPITGTPVTTIVSGTATAGGTITVGTGGGIATTAGV
jgi:hypothetical protein